MENAIYIPLLNVDSEHCAYIVNKGLSEVKELASHKIELNNNSAVITVKKNPVEAIQAAVQKINSLGYQVATVKQTFPVTNLSCASCAANTEAILNQQLGVVKAEVNFANTSASVAYIPTLVNAKMLKKAVQAAGYDLLIDDSNEAKDSFLAIKESYYLALRKRVIGATILAIPLFVVGMFLMDMPYVNYIMWALATPMIFIYGKPFFVGAWRQAAHRSANMDTLVAISTGTAYFYSVLVTLFPRLMHQWGIHSHVYFEAAGIVIAFILLGKLLEEKAKGNTSSAIKKLIGLQPKQVTLVQANGQQLETDINAVSVGDIILVKPGERIAVDGRVTNGISYVDESMISGEPLPISKKEGSPVLAGTINQKGSFQFRAEKVGSDTVLSHIIKMVEEAQGSKAPVQKLVDKIAAVFVPIVIAIAIVSFFVWTIWGGENGVSQGIIAFVTVLVIACPCALGLATPTAIMVGVGKAAEKGILVKDAESLELTQKVNAIILDKTGTITEGKPKVNGMQWFVNDNGESQNILYSIEKSSEHPLADAITDYLKPKAQLINGIEIENLTGQGISGKLGQSIYVVGNLKLAQQQGVEISEQVQQWIDAQLNAAQTVVLFYNTSTVLATIAIADSIKASSKKALQELCHTGIEVYMLTGDNEQSAKMVADELKIEHYSANVLPADKANFVKALQAKGKLVAMVGDGINDSAALAQADVSIAMGKGSDIAMETAKITIISSDLLKITEAIHLSKNTVQTIKQNLFWAFIYNVVGIPIAAGILFPINGFLLNPMWAGAAMALSSVSVVANSLRLKIKY